MNAEMKTMSMTDSEPYQFRTLTGYDQLVIYLPGRAGQWLAGTTRTSDGYIVGNRTLFHDLLSRMQLSPITSNGFRRSIPLREGQAQYSELQLQDEWNIGRKVIRRLLDEMQDVGLVTMDKSTVASTVSFPFIKGWRMTGQGFIANPFYVSYNNHLEEGGSL